MMKMTKKGKKQLLGAMGWLLLFLCLTAAVKLIDVRPIGPQGSAVGFAGINGWVCDLCGYRAMWYEITDLLGKAALVVALGFAALGGVQLLKRRSLKKVDADLYLLALAYVAVGLAYVFFEICIVNYRPIILETELEASFPSSHTMMVLGIMGTAAVQFRRRIRSRELRSAAVLLSKVMIVVMIAGRLLSGVHWFTDIVGGVLLGMAIVCAYAGACACIVQPHRRKKRAGETAAQREH